MEENPLVSSWSCMLLAEHRPILMSLRKWIRFHYLGGGDEVGNVGIVMEDPSGTRLLLDYGIAPTSPPRYPSEAPLVHDAVITHSHIDHLGMAPWLCAHHHPPSRDHHHRPAF